MIGVIGPPDSVALVTSLAAEAGQESRLLARTYAHTSETPDLARELDAHCTVLLFTGRVPFELSQDVGLEAELRHISHSGADLYRGMASVLAERAGVMPRLSVDSIDPDEARDAFADLGFPVPVAMPLGPSSSVIDDVVRFHRDQLDRDAADAVLTCLSEVAARLQADGVPVWRLNHTKAAVRGALDGAVLADRLHRSRVVQPAVALYRVEPAPTASSYDRERGRVAVQSALLPVARKYGGRLSMVDSDTFAITTSRGAIETAIERQRAGHASLLDPPQAPVALTAGVGIGTSYAQAEANARDALDLYRPEHGLAVVFADGRVHARDARAYRHLQVEDVTDRYRTLGARLGIGALAAKRLVEALGKVDTSALTAKELADAYGVQARSARRLLAALAATGYATESGTRARSKAGRPQTLYRVDVASLMDVVDRPGG